VPEAPLRLAPKAATEVFRIVQEALTNVARHAHARQVRLTLREDGEGLLLCLADDGVGIGPAPQRTGAIGLLSMSERARGLGAVFEARPGAQGGTEVTLRVPQGDGPEAAAP
jgi:signal transduction histidine kinase